MILVLTGTTYAFDALVMAMDAIAPRLGEPVIVQRGQSAYVPRHCACFDFAASLGAYIKDASLVVSHGGAGSSYEILASGKPLVSVENKEVNDSHQWDLLQKLEAEGYIVWCRDLATLEDAIRTARRKTFARYVPPACTIHYEIVKFLDSS